MSTIRMGNDEFILYIRKWNPACMITNEQLGRQIWEWIEKNDRLKPRQLTREECVWGKEANNVSRDDLPYTATQFEFSRSLLPRLYDFLDSL